jgi:hypothetical protein
MPTADAADTLQPSASTSESQLVAVSTSSTAAEDQQATIPAALETIAGSPVNGKEIATPATADELFDSVNTAATTLESEKANAPVAAAAAKTKKIPTSKPLLELQVFDEDGTCCIVTRVRVCCASSLPPRADAESSCRTASEQQRQSSRIALG